MRASVDIGPAVVDELGLDPAAPAGPLDRLGTRLDDELADRLVPIRLAGPSPVRSANG